MLKWDHESFCNAQFEQAAYCWIKKGGGGYNLWVSTGLNIFTPKIGLVMFGLQTSYPITVKKISHGRGGGALAS